MADPLGVVGDLSAAVSALAPSPQQALIGRLSSPQLSFRQFAAPRRAREFSALFGDAAASSSVGSSTGGGGFVSLFDDEAATSLTTRGGGGGGGGGSSSRRPRGDTAAMLARLSRALFAAFAESEGYAAALQEVEAFVATQQAAFGALYAAGSEPSDGARARAHSQR